MTTVGQSAASATAPTAGSTYVDDTGRTLTVAAVQPGSKQDRHVVGVVNSKPYACSFAVFEVIWAQREVRAEEVRAEEVHVHVTDKREKPARTPLYASDGTPLPYTRRS